MQKNNFPETLKRFDDWRARKACTILVVADISRPGPVFTGIAEFANMETAHSKHLEYLKNGTSYGDAIPDMSSYLGSGSLSAFIGSLPIYSDNTIWFKEGCTTSDELIQNCVDFINNNSTSVFDWYKWSLQDAWSYKEYSNDQYMTSMPDLYLNLDIVATVMGVDRMFLEIIDNPKKIHEILDNVIYHLNRPGAVRYIDSILIIDKINAVQ